MSCFCVEGEQGTEPSQKSTTCKSKDEINSRIIKGSMPNGDLRGNVCCGWIKKHLLHVIDEKTWTCFTSSSCAFNQWGSMSEGLDLRQLLSWSVSCFFRRLPVLHTVGAHQSHTRYTVMREAHPVVFMAGNSPLSPFNHIICMCRSCWQRRSIYGY